jgi:pilus assembly protein CpaC
MVKRASLEWKAATARLLGGGILVISLCLWAGGGPAKGADLLEKVRDQEIKQVLRLRVGSSKVIKTPFPVTRVSVANPEIADILVINDREIYVNGLGPGVTNVTIWGKNRFTSTSVNVEMDVSLLKEKLHKILPKEKIGVEAVGDSIVLSGEVSSLAAQQTAVELASGFLREQVSLKEMEGMTVTHITMEGKGDKGGKPGEGAPVSGGQKKFKDVKVINLMHVGGVQQVMVEVRVAEIQRNLGRQIGVNFGAFDRQGNFGISFLDRITSIQSFTRGFDATSILLNFSNVINAAAGWKTGSVLWTAFFNVLKQQGLGRILAEPNLVATSGQEALFLAGGEFPVPVPQPGAGGSVVTIEWKKFGVQLAFNTVVLDDSKIALKVAPTVSELDFTTAPVIIAGLQIPGLRVRSTGTHVEVKDGQTFAIAGLLSDTHRNAVSKYPILGDIPIIGDLFRSANYQKNETELVILVTPRLVKPLTTTAVRLPTDKYVEPTDFEAYLLGALEGRTKKNAAGAPPAQKLPEGFGPKSLQ